MKLHCNPKVMAEPCRPVHVAVVARNTGLVFMVLSGGKLTAVIIEFGKFATIGAGGGAAGALDDVHITG